MVARMHMAVQTPVRTFIIRPVIKLHPPFTLMTSFPMHSKASKSRVLPWGEGLCINWRRGFA